MTPLEQCLVQFSSIVAVTVPAAISTLILLLLKFTVSATIDASACLRALVVS